MNFNQKTEMHGALETQVVRADPEAESRAQLLDLIHEVQNVYRGLATCISDASADDWGEALGHVQRAHENIGQVLALLLRMEEIHVGTLQEEAGDQLPC